MREVPGTRLHPDRVIWRATGAAVLLAAWALESAWRRRWRERWAYGSPKAGIVLASERWERHRRFIPPG
ncbi:MAG: hypothetical protein JO075_05150 [Acidimicrobiia bacterium]|nr:hypothetical protein [Acidimicrobiia bacterium]